MMYVCFWLHVGSVNLKAACERAVKFIPGWPCSRGVLLRLLPAGLSPLTSCEITSMFLIRPPVKAGPEGHEHRAAGREGWWLVVPTRVATGSAAEHRNDAQARSQSLHGDESACGTNTAAVPRGAVVVGGAVGGNASRANLIQDGDKCFLWRSHAATSSTQDPREVAPAAIIARADIRL
jgi:hypothetical protein